MLKLYAIEQTIKILNCILKYTEKENKVELKNIINELSELAEMLPLTRWDQNTIIESIDQYIYKKHRFPKLSDFNATNKLPSKSTIQKCFNMNITEFINCYYKEEYHNQKKKRHREDIETLIKNFKSDYLRIGECNEKEFNMNRSPNTASSRTIMRRFNLTSWNSLILYLGLKPNKPPIKIIRSYMNSSKEENEEIKKILSEKTKK